MTKSKSTAIPAERLPREDRPAHNEAAERLLDQGAVRGNVSGGVGENPVSMGGDVGDQGNRGAARPPDNGPRATSRLGPGPDPKAGVEPGLSAAARRAGSEGGFDAEAAVAHGGETGAGGFSRILPARPAPRERPTDSEARLEQLHGAMPGGDTFGGPADLRRVVDGDEALPDA